MVAEVTGLITATASFLTALGGIFVTVKVLWPIMRTGASTHKIVNQQRTDMQEHIEVLEKASRAMGVEPPGRSE